MKATSLSCMALLALSASSCGPGLEPEVVVHQPRPLAPAESEKGDGRCRTAAHPAPLIVDWLPTRRSDLDAAMKNGIAVVSYDCTSLKLLKDCKLKGSYAFAGVPRREQALQLTTDIELQSNMPSTGMDLSGELKRGGVIDVGLVVLGEKATALALAARPELEGSCTGATHAVKSVSVGAFAMATGAPGKARTLEEIFKAAAPGGSQAGISGKEGEIEACRGAKADAAAPTERCQTALRLALVPLEEQWPSTKPAEEDKHALQDPCPVGTRLSGGKCASPAQASAHLCKADDARGCSEQCDKGDLGSCYHLAFHYLSGKDLARDDARAAGLFEKACAGGVSRACYDGAEQRARELSAAKDEAAKAEVRGKAQKLADRACELGDGWACSAVADWYLREGAFAAFPRDPGRAVSLLRRGCDLGHAPGCSALASLLMEGKSTAKDVPAAVGLLQRACQGGQVEDCGALGDVLRKGQGVPKDGLKALEAFVRGCGMGDKRACNSAGSVYADGDGLPKDPAKAYSYFQMGCPERGVTGSEACLSLAAMYEKGTSIPKDTARAVELYERVCAMGGCTRAAEMYQKGEGVTADPERALSLYEKSCTTWSEPRACEALGPLLEKKDKERARAFYGDRCAKTKDKGACAGLKRLGGTPPPAGK